MVIGIAHIYVRVPDNHSLKGKRRVIKSLIERVNNRYNVAISEVAEHDVLQRAEIGICTVGNSQPVIDSVLNKAVNFIEGTFLVEIIDMDIEIIHIP